MEGYHKGKAVDIIGSSSAQSVVIPEKKKKVRFRSPDSLAKVMHLESEVVDAQERSSNAHGDASTLISAVTSTPDIPPLAAAKKKKGWNPLKAMRKSSHEATHLEAAPSSSIDKGEQANPLGEERRKRKCFNGWTGLLTKLC